MERRSYRQFCTMARTLDLVGERWTLLLVRELMIGPQRFTDLLEGLAGIGRNLLADRLRRLEEHGLVKRRRLPPPAGSRVYELTEDGRALGPVLTALGRWGAEHLEPAPSDFLFRAAWMMFPLSYMADIEAARGVHQIYEFRVGEETFHLKVDDGSVIPERGPASAADVVFSIDPLSFRQLFTGELTAPDALAQGRVQVEGSAEDTIRALAILSGSPMI